MMTQEGRTQVFFDGSCPLCRAEIAMYGRVDAVGAFCLIDVSAQDVTLPPTLDRQTAQARFHVMPTDGQLLSGAAAFVEIWRQLPGWRWAARLAALPGMLTLLELSYRAFLLMRPALVRLFTGIDRR